MFEENVLDAPETTCGESGDLGFNNRLLEQVS